MRTLVLLLVLAGCTDAERANMTTLGSAGDVVCYSGGREVYRGRSTGKILSEEHSDGWQFVDQATGKFIRVSGDCLITN